MKKEVNPLLVGIVILALVVGLGVFFWQRTAGRSPGQGKLQIDLDLSKAEKDPAKFTKEMDDLVRRDREAHGGGAR